MDMDTAGPVVVTPDTRGAFAGGPAPADIIVAVDAPARFQRPQEGAPARRPAPSSGDVPALLSRAPREVSIADGQLLAAAELVRRGMATRVLLANAAVDSGLPDELRLRGTPIRLERMPDGRTRVTAGSRSR
jgi:hypothetical protein